MECCWSTVELLPGPLIPKVVPLVSPILLPRIVTSLTFQPSSSACNKVIRLFCCVEKLEDIAAPVSCVLQDVPQGDLKVLWPQQTFHQINFNYDLGCTFPNNLPLRLSPFFASWLQPTIIRSRGGPKLACHHPSLAEADEPCLHGALLYLSHLDHSDTRRLMSFEPKVSKIFRPLRLLLLSNSPEIHLHIIWSQQIF